MPDNGQYGNTTYDNNQGTCPDGLYYPAATVPGFEPASDEAGAYRISLRCDYDSDERPAISSLIVLEQ